MIQGRYRSGCRNGRPGTSFYDGGEEGAMLRKIIALLFIALLLFFIVQSARLVLRIHHREKGRTESALPGPSALSQRRF
ncbi:MAG: hypothetical protein ACFN2Z_00475 [Oribacterium sp.]